LTGQKIDNGLLFTTGSVVVHPVVGPLATAGLTGEISMDAWVRVDVTTNYDRSIIDFRDPSSGQGYRLYVAALPVHNFAFEVTGAGGAPITVTVPASIPLTSGWHLVGASVCLDNSTPPRQVVTISVDGTAISLPPVPWPALGSFAPPFGIPLTIGQDAINGLPFEGAIDEVEIFDCCVDAGFFADLFVAGELGVGKCKERC
jgi:hypothetical protein